MSFTIDIFDQKGKKIKTVDLDTSLFSKDNINTDLMYQFVQMQHANSRVVIASTKTRAQVSWSTKKLYKQKWNGTGRVGDRRSPLRKKGWVAFGPTSLRNFSVSMPKKMRKAALRSALSLKAMESSFIGLDTFDVTTPSTKVALESLKNLGLERSVLVLTHDAEKAIQSYRNLSFVEIVDVAYVSVFDLLKAKKVVLIGEALDKLTEYNKKA